MKRVFGVDFSGSKYAGRKIWIASGHLQDDRLTIDDVRPAAHLPGGPVNREGALSALRQFIAAQGEAVFGLDFPFSLPLSLMKHDSWEQFALSFGDDYADEDDFKQQCRTLAGGKELKRLTDKEAKTPFAAYNLRLYRQTFYGIRDVLAPLVRDNLACVLPMQSPAPDKPILLEICPNCTLTALRLYKSYKGKTLVHHQNRQSILLALINEVGVQIPQALRLSLLGNYDGDALDSVIAVNAIAQYVMNALVVDQSRYGLEGYVYV